MYFTGSVVYTHGVSETGSDLGYWKDSYKQWETISLEMQYKSGTVSCICGMYAPKIR